MLFFKRNKVKIKTIEKTTSTNTEIKNFIENNLFLIANSQTAGKTTKKDVEWKEGKGNLYLSSSHKITPGLNKQLQTIGLIASYSAVETIKELINNKDIKSKWPNDLILENKKLGGILCERHNKFIIIGIGINLAQAPADTFSGDKKTTPATSLKENGIKITPEEFTKMYSKELIKNIKLLEKHSFKYFLETMKIEKNYWKLNEEVHNKSISGIFRGLDENGFLLLERNNKIKAIRAI